MAMTTVFQSLACAAGARTGAAASDKAAPSAFMNPSDISPTPVCRLRSSAGLFPTRHASGRGQPLTFGAREERALSAQERAQAPYWGVRSTLNHCSEYFLTDPSAIASASALSNLAVRSASVLRMPMPSPTPNTPPINFGPTTASSEASGLEAVAMLVGRSSSTASRRPALRSRSRSSVVLYSLTVAMSLRYWVPKLACVVETCTPSVLPLSAACTDLIAASPAAGSLSRLMSVPAPVVLASRLSFGARNEPGEAA